MHTVPRWLRLLPLCAALCLGGFRCDRGPEHATSAPPQPAPLGAPDLTLLLLTDPKGYLEPCGCQQRPLGGVDKLAAVVRQVRTQPQPTLLLAAGPTFFGAELRGDDREQAQSQERWKAETLTQVYNALAMGAVAPGPLDFSQGPDVTRDLREHAEFPWLSATLRGESEPALAPSAVLKAGSLRVGVVGSQAEDPGHPWPAPLSVGPVDAARDAIAALRTQGVDLVIALHVGDRRSARQVAKAGADLVLAGGLDEQDPLPPSELDDHWILQAGRQGQGVLRVDLKLSGKGPLVDVSEWSVRAKQAQLVEEARTLAEKIAGWEKDPSVNRDDLARQKQRLDALRRDTKRLERPDHQGRWLSARWLELDPETPSDAQIAAKVDAYDKRVNAHNQKALADRKPVPAPPGAPHYLGSESCGACHAAAYTWWKGTPHGNAYATLQKVHKEFNLSCVGCHVTGYNQPGGSTVTHVQKLTDVGCENCHGPGSQHANHPQQEGAIARTVPEQVCTGCHNPQHSARFQYEGFKEMLIVPGHGLPGSGAGGG